MRIYTVCGSLAAALLFAACTASIPAPPPEPAGRTAAVKKRPAAAQRDLKIPPGHLPPAGQCRIWHPALPPGRQPPPGPCARVAGRVPPGSWLVTRPRKNPANVEVRVYDPVKKNVIIQVRLYNIDSGKLLSEREP